MTTIGPFRLVDPPPGQAEVIAATVAAIDYPWERLATALGRDPDGAVLVSWVPSNEFGGTGTFYGSTYEIHLSTQFASYADNVPFVFAHEVGHLVDRATFDTATRQALTDLFHASPLTHRYDGQQMNGVEHGWSHRQPHADTWTSHDDYLFRLNEAYADAFVAAFAPGAWEGHSPRFVHTTDDHDAVRRLTLAAGQAAEPVHADDTTQPRTMTMTRGKHIDNALHELKAWREGHRERSWVATIKVLAAQTALRSIRRRPV